MDTSRICIDTGPLIHYLRNSEPGAGSVEKAVKNSVCFVTAITAYELLFGAARAQRRLSEHDLLGIMVVLPFGYREAQQAAELHAELISRNQDIGVKDVLIAAICLEHDLPLLTTNIRHFERISTLQIISPDSFLENNFRNR